VLKYSDGDRLEFEADRMGGAERSGVDGVTVVSFFPFQVNFRDWMNHGMLPGLSP